MRVRSAVGALLCAWLVAAGAAAQDLRGDWPGDGGGAARTAATEAPTHGGRASHFGMAWSVALDAPVAGGVVLADRFALVADAQGRLHALDLLTGCPCWQASLGEPVIAPPAVAGDRWVVAGRSGAVRAGLCADGRAAWQARLPAGVEAAPLPVDGAFVLATREGHVVALDAATGTERWRAELGAPVFAAPAGADGRAVVLAVDGTCRSLDAATGATRWEARVGEGPCYAAPVLAGGRCYTVAGDGTVSAFTAATGTRRFRVALDKRVTANPAFRAGRLYVVAEDGDCRGFDAESGEAAFECRFGPPGAPFRAGLLVGPDWLVVPGYDGTIRLRGVGPDRRPVPALQPRGGLQPLPAPPAPHPGGWVGVRADGVVFAQREPWADRRVAEALLELPPALDPVEVALAAHRLAGPEATLAAAELCRAGLPGHEIVAQVASAGRADLRSAAAAWRDHLRYLVHWVADLRRGLQADGPRSEASAARRRRLWRTFLDHERPDVAAAALARWRADGGTGLPDFDPLWPVAKRRRLVAELPD
jgi:hypothetical protein